MPVILLTGLPLFLALDDIERSVVLRLGEQRGTAIHGHDLRGT